MTQIVQTRIHRHHDSKDDGWIAGRGKVGKAWRMGWGTANLTQSHDVFGGFQSSWNR